jgi:hypothetical protein
MSLRLHQGKRCNSGELRHTKHNESKLMPSLCSGTALAIYLKALTRRSEALLLAVASLQSLAVKQLAHNVPCLSYSARRSTKRWGWHPSEGMVLRKAKAFQALK